MVLRNALHQIRPLDRAAAALDASLLRSGHSPLTDGQMECLSDTARRCEALAMLDDLRDRCGADTSAVVQALINA